MNWRIGISRIMLVLWGIWSAFFIPLLFGDSRDDKILALQFIAGGLIAFVAIGWAVSWIIEGFSSEAPRDHYSE